MKKTLIVIMLMAAMAFAGVSTTYNKILYSCTGGTAYTFSFPVESASDIRVKLLTIATGAETLLIKDSQYTVSATNNDYSTGGTVTTVTAYGTDYKLLIIRNTPLTQETDLISDSGVLRTQTLVNAIDKQMRISQDLSEKAARSLKIAEGDPNNLITTVPSATERANKWLACDEYGNFIMSSGPRGDSNIPISSFIEPILNDSSAAMVRTDLGINLTNIATIYNVKDYNAIGDGVADDTTAIQNALNAVSSKGGIVYFPTGTYIVTGITVAGYGTKIIGAGKYSTIIKLKDDTNGSTPIINTNAKAGLVLQDFRIDGNRTNNATYTGYGIYVKTTVNSRFAGVDVRYTNGTAWYITNSNANVFLNITAQQCSGMGFYIGSGAGGDDIGGCWSNTFSSLVVGTAVDYGIWCRGPQNTFTSPYIENMTSSGTSIGIKDDSRDNRWISPEVHNVDANTPIGIGIQLAKARRCFVSNPHFGACTVPLNFTGTNSYATVLGFDSDSYSYTNTDSDTTILVTRSIADKTYVNNRTTMTPAITGAGTGYADQNSVTLANGLIFKTGSVTVSGDSYASVTFDTNFPTKAKSAQVTPRTVIDINMVQGIWGFTSLSTSGLKVKNGLNDQYIFDWLAWGY